MEVKDIVDVNVVRTQMKAKTKREAITELAELLQKNGYLSNVDGYVKDVYAREAEGQTGIGNYVAIPHGKSEFVNRVGVAIGINETEIPWESLDDHGAKVIILFAVGNDTESAKEHLKLLSLFARKLGNDEVVGNLLAAKTSAEVVAAFA
ncbi:PTS sugar transporter subunit IIA [Enterococcus sp. CSURQ0835]|uniref:PTS sugar transporter subunit IIA n=1 Tax=Enterococcus sp. CSURQ0835 TaxID=2681394 RepID=UPI00135A84E7|nr:fructose PTS transporter subunit IIA [Enterococcus sp. CSURQ0835]